MANDDLEVLKSGRPKLGIIEQYESTNGMRWVQTDKVPTFDKNGVSTGLVGFAQDITERKRMEKSLKESEGRLRSIIENSSDQIFMLDRDCRFLLINKVAADLFGLVPQEVVGRSLSDVFPEIIAAQFSKNIKNVVDTGRSMFIEEKMVVKGRELYSSTSLNPVRNDSGRVIAVTGIVRDITEHKKAEESLNRLMDELVRVNEKLGVVGSLTRHDVRNKLSTVTGFAYLLKRKHADQADVVEGLGRMEEAVKESMKIFDFAKLYEQLGAEELALIDVEAKINEAIALFSGSFPKIINECHGLTVLADSFLRQMFYNFIDNTKKYGQKTTIIKIHSQKTDADSLKLIYEDDGVGISAENKLKLFSEGFSTGSSTGFGLFLIKKMVDVYGWTILEEGEQGKGVKFIITLPKLNKYGKENYQITPRPPPTIHV